ncbi:MAG: thioredoxin family protein [Dysgonamonadaceae bacterium]|jgi:thiol:disulfide interchange protein DsbD|nr:thioredoxin family protein [Dysgonamonadaceae bacterium]
MLKRFTLFIFFALLGFSSYAQIKEPVKWKKYVNSSGELVFAATIEKGWHLYDMNMPSGGPIPTSFVFETVKGAGLSGKMSTTMGITTSYDDLFGMDISWYKDNPTFVQKLKITDPEKFRIEGYINYMSCNDENCIALKEEFSFGKNDLPAGLTISKETAAPETTPTTEQTVTETAPAEVTPIAAPTDSLQANNAADSDLWQPVIEELQNYGTSENSSSLWLIFWMCFGGGFIALLTPCVWPIIPMTVSFFLKRSKTNRKKAISDALMYGLSIIVIYLVLGLIITLTFGASALNSLSTNPFFNLVFFALLVIFAISFFGAFELTLPSSWTNKMDSKAESTTGILSIFFMAFTLVLVSFSCTGPIIGGLLVQAVSMGSITGPAVGMFGFGLALAIPFAFFAIFPSFLNDLPKSGGWLNSVKVVLGFLELALALKFLSVADFSLRQTYQTGFHILDREVFLVLWIVIFALLGLYLLGKLKLPHDSDLKHVSVTRLFLAIISFAFAIYMVPGLWGAPLKAISAFSPPLYTQDFNLYNGEVHPKFYDYDEGMAQAKKQGKPVMIDFTGFGCVNCREMEASVWSDPRVKSLIDNEYILISLYVDDKTPLPETIEVEEYGKTSKLRTIGDKWSYLQRHKFGANAQPFYVLVDNEGFPIALSRAYKKDIEEYIQFLQEGINTYKSKVKY